MSDNSPEKLELLLSELEQSLPDLNVIQNALWTTTTQCKTLLQREDLALKNVKITSQARRFTPNKLTYLRGIYFYGDNTSKIAENIKFRVKAPGRDPFFSNLTPGKYHASTHLFDFCEWFEISSTSVFGKPTLSRIDIYGADLDLLKTYSSDIEDVIDTKRKIEDIKNETKNHYNDAILKISNKSLEIENLEAETNTLKEAISLQTQLSREIASQIEIETARLAEIKLNSEHTLNNLSSAENNFSQLKQQLTSINNKIYDQNEDLARLTSDRNLISDEYGPYVKEGHTQAKLYTAISLIPLAIMFFSVYEIYSGANKLLTTPYSSITEIMGAFLLRIPFAIVFGLGILYCWKITSTIIQKIFKIHSDRLTLAKLLVLAREAVHSSAKTLDITDEQVMKEQIKLKIEVLKGHLSHDIGPNFSYDPTATKKPPAFIKESASNDSTVEDQERENKESP